jgi:hypothetical protein
MAVNLIRNSKVYFTTSLNSDGSVNFAGCDNTNTQELQVLDGMSFSQNTTTETVTLNEAGAAPSRGQRSFNTSLAPVDFSFSTYIRPYYNELGAQDGLTAEESVLWNALMGVNAIGSGGAWTATPSATAPTAVATYSKANSNVHQLQKFAVIINVDNLQYIIENCVLNTATIDFGLDAIATIQWAGQGTKLTQDSSASTIAAYKAKNTAAKFIANKLSVVTLYSGINATSGTAYTIPLTGGQIVLSNNVTFLTPQNLGIVNKPTTYFTGTRAVSGNMTAYLRAGGGAGNYSAELLDTLLAGSSTAVDTKFTLTIKIGGSTGTHVDIKLPAAMISIPTVQTEQIVSTTINFTGQSYTGTDFDIEEANEVTVTYNVAA